jgi:hypothetical protein
VQLDYMLQQGKTPETREVLLLVFIARLGQPGVAIFPLSVLFQTLWGTVGARTGCCSVAAPRQVAALSPGSYLPPPVNMSVQNRRPWTKSPPSCMFVQHRRPWAKSPPSCMFVQHRRPWAKSLNLLHVRTALPRRRSCQRPPPSPSPPRSAALPVTASVAAAPRRHQGPPPSRSL